MLTFHKPENAIRRVEELRSIGQDETALQLLHSVVNHRRFRVHGWDSSQELMMIQYIILSVDLQKPRMAREGLHQYRYVTHQSNIGSLGKVIVEFRNRAEEQLQSVKNECVDCMDPNLIKENLEQEETPESLLLASLQIERRGAKEKKLHETLRFTWEAYKMILDIIRLTPKLERIYHETAQRALEFCWQHNRASEFKTLCELLRSHYQLLVSNRHRPEIEVMLRPECHLETRIVQLRGAAKLSLWNECFTTAEEIFHLGIFQFDPLIGNSFSQNTSFANNQGSQMNSLHNNAHQGNIVSGSSLPLHSNTSNNTNSQNMDSAHAMKVRPTYLRWVALYYDILSKMFLLTENYSFHALAHLKYFLHLRQFKKNVTQEELTKMASTVVLAVLSIPLSENSSSLNSKSRYFTGNMPSSDYYQHGGDQVKKAALLLGSLFIPTREILKSMLISKNILGLSLPVCQQLYGIIEGRSSTLKLCVSTNDLLANLMKADPEFNEYTRPLKVTILTKLFLLISRVYSSICIEQFLKNICPDDFLPWTDTEKLLVQLSNSSIINLRIDYARKCIYSVDKCLGYNSGYKNGGNISSFGSCIVNGSSGLSQINAINNSSSNSCSRYSSQLSTSAFMLESLLRNLDSDNIKIGLQNQNNKISQMVQRRLPIEMISMEKRIEEIKLRRKERIEELKRVEEDKKRQEKEAKAQEELLEIQKREEDRRRREEARQLEEIKKNKVEACRIMLDTIKKLAFKNTNSNKIVLKGKLLDEITLEDLLEGRILYDDLERLQEEQCNYERQERIKQRKQEAKRLDHLARAYRLEEIPLIKEWNNRIAQNDEELHKQLQSNYQLKIEEIKKEAHKEKEILKTVLPYLNDWKDKKLEIRKVELMDELKVQRLRCIKRIKELKISRAKIRRNEAIEKKLHEEEQRRKEEEAKREEEEARLLEEAKRQKEEKRLKMQRQMEIQRKREEEIEAKLMAANSKTSSSGPANSNNNIGSDDRGDSINFSRDRSGNNAPNRGIGSASRQNSSNSSGISFMRQKTGSQRSGSPSKVDFTRDLTRLSSNPSSIGAANSDVKANSGNLSFGRTNSNKNVSFSDLRRTGTNDQSKNQQQSSLSSGRTFGSSTRAGTNSQNERDTRDIDNNKWR
ncbi:putative eukaryotic translation initiation factor 3 [Cryptosporidium canis]|uniref:Eukaryotic translation initiation factor 3 n=1 Tax=Cryptosporidium canis TaxID=195482 RepID=A0ABQ8P502_9CRYT|nr:putative eukaryotic translation initiation factor 3 [Cryptosporidium canis]KAJ1613852.1 putative eukaryotic translation initiation factor 3 [Cryptosporidium canis]